MEIGQIILGAALGAGVLWWINKEKDKKENPTTEEILGIEDQLRRLEASEKAHTPHYLQPQPAMMPMPSPYPQMPVYPGYGRGLF